MDKLFLFFSFLFLIAINSCSTSPVTGHADFATEKSMPFKEHNISALMGMPMDMLILSDLIVVLDSQTDNFFHVFSIEDFNYRGSFISKGHGPGEEIFIHPYFKAYSDNEFYYQAAEKLKIALVNKDDDSINIIVEDEYILPTSSLSDIDFFIIDELIFSSNSPRASLKDYFVINNETDEVSEWGEPAPLSNAKINPLLLQTVNQKLSTVNKQNNCIASVYNVLPLLRIYSLESEKLICELQSSTASDNLIVLRTTEVKKEVGDLINYYHRIKSTDEYIYALYGGFSVSSYFQENETPHLFDFSNEIHIWKWDGTPIMKLKLERSVFAFDVSPDNKKIIATSVVDVDKFFEADIPWD